MFSPAVLTPTFANPMAYRVFHLDTWRDGVETIRINAVVTFRVCPKAGTGTVRLYPHQMTVWAFINIVD
jgi:hypothetical protein